jgi:hypothetical protein
MSDDKSIFDVFVDLEKARNPPLWEVRGTSDKDCNIFYCRAIDEASVKKQFEAALAEGLPDHTLLWDYQIAGQIVHLLLPPWKTEKDLEGLNYVPGHRTKTLTISEVALNVIMDFF